MLEVPAGLAGGEEGALVSREVVGDQRFTAGQDQTGQRVADRRTRPRASFAPSPSAYSIVSRRRCSSGSATVTRSASDSSSACLVRAASAVPDEAPDSSWVAISAVASCQRCCRRASS